MMFVVCPTIAVIGLLSNMFGSIILMKDGLRKSSTIFLMSLTVADSMTLFGALYPTYLIKYTLTQNFTCNYIGWFYSYLVSLLVVILDQIMFFSVILGSYVSMTLPPAISIERVFAVYFPIQFKQTLTSKKTKVIVFIIYMTWVLWCSFYLSCYSFRYTFSGEGTMKLTEFCNKNWETILLMNNYIFNYLTSIVPLVIVLLGSLLVSIKIKLTTRKRREISTNQRPGSLRATRTLLTVSVLFSVVNFTYFLTTTLLAQHPAVDVKLQDVVTLCMYALVYIGCSSNFFVYIMLNEKYKSLFLGLFRVKGK